MTNVNPTPDRSRKGPLTDFDVMREIMDDWDGEIYVREAPFEQVLQDFYGNLMDDLHDSRGDSDYQRDVLERMAIIERWLKVFRVTPFPTFSEADKAREIEPVGLAPER